MPAKRRALLASLGTVPFAGCLTDSSGEDGPDDPSAPDDGAPIDKNATDPADEPTAGLFDSDRLTPCSTTKGLDAAWPTELNASTAGSFVAAYETEYFREVALSWEPNHSVDAYTISFSSVGDPEPRSDGYLVELEWSGVAHHLYGLEISGRVRNASADASVVPVSDVGDDTLTEYLRRVATGDPELLVLRTEETDIERYLDLFENTFDEYEPIPQETRLSTHFVDVDGTVIQIGIQTASTGLEYSIQTHWYYVDERVLVRTLADPPERIEDGQLVECRKA